MAKSHAQRHYALPEALSYGHAIPYQSPPVYRYQGYRHPHCSLLIPDRQMVGVGC